MALRDWYTCVISPDGTTKPAIKGNGLCWRIPRINPDDFPRTFPGDGPRPFMTHPALSSSDVHHMQVLATIDALAGELPQALSQPFHHAVAEHMRHLNGKLGDDFQITQHDHQEARHAAE
jgi:hypothetical protein